MTLLCISACLSSHLQKCHIFRLSRLIYKIIDDFPFSVYESFVYSLPVRVFLSMRALFSSLPMRKSWSENGNQS